MNLFESQEKMNRDRVRPLAARMRPVQLSEFTGQQHILGEGMLLRRMITADRLGSMIFYGPPGTGKTSLAEVIARSTRRRFEKINATTSGVKEIREIIEAAEERLSAGGARTILFIDELHRFSRSQQDVLLPHLEDGIVSLIGATTANPFFVLVPPLISRSQIFEFRELSATDLLSLLRRALQDQQKGLGSREVVVDDDALQWIASQCDGDARRALTALEIAVLSVESTGRKVDSEVARESFQRRAVRFDAAGDDHYDVASAFIKSIRGSDPDAAVYWLARMLESGEDPRFIARRLVIAAAEDIGNADPMAVLVADAAFRATETVGMPECRINLAQATTYLACTEKSNSACRAIDLALHDVRTQSVLPVPMHLRDGHYQGAERLGHGAGYQYPHDSPSGWVNQDYLGVARSYYQPVDRGREAVFQKRLEGLRDLRESGDL